MKVYFAGEAGLKEREKRWLELFSKYLFSFWNIIHGPHQSESTVYTLIKMNKEIELFLDSGAFSAWTQKKVINVKDYIEFIKKYEDLITVYANLDVIGDAKATWKNQSIMERAGLHPLPVYHRQDNIKYLHRCINEYDYFCLGGMAKGFTAFDRTSFLDRCFDIICDTPDRLPKCKVHGFGMTSFSLMLRYPWFSVDSTTWIMTGRMGAIYIPRWVNNKWIYDENSWRITVSNRNPNTKEKGKHLTNSSEEEKKVFLRYIKEKGYKFGVSEFKKVDSSHKLAENERWAENKTKNPTRDLEIIIEPGISNTYQLRDEMNIIYFLDLENSRPKWPWPFIKQSAKGLGLDLEGYE